VPIVFTRVSDPVGQGLITNFAKPGGNITGFINFEPSMAGKWLQVLKEVVPDIRHVAVMGNPQTSALDAYFQSIQAAAGPLAVQPARAAVRSPDDIERAIASASELRPAGLVVIPDGVLIANQATIVAQAAKYRVPAIYPFGSFVAAGGLAAYTIDTDEELRGAASYVDRILRGDKPGDLPAQAPTKFRLIINLKVAKALGLDVSSLLLARADEVIE